MEKEIENLNNIKNDKLKFEGKYLNGERNGKGKKYNYDSKLVYEWENIDGKRDWNFINFNFKFK